MLVTMDRAGRIVIPKDVRERLGLQPDTEYELTIEGDEIRLSPVRRLGRRIVEVDGWPVLEGVEGLRLTDADVARWRDDVHR